MKAQMDHEIRLTEEEQETIDLMFDYFFERLVYIVEQNPSKAHALNVFGDLKDKVFTALKGRELH